MCNEGKELGEASIHHSVRVGVDIAYIVYIRKSGEKKRDNQKVNTMDDTLLCLPFRTFSIKKMKVCSKSD